MLTLKEIILVKLAAGFINDSNTRIIINNFKEEVWKKAMREKVSTLDIPLTLQEEIIALIKPIKSEVNSWMEDHDGIFTTEQECSLRFCFSADGTVDRIKTADSLIHSKWLGARTRFVLACQYWSSWEVLTFFTKLPRTTKLQIQRKYSKINQKINEHEKNVAKWIELYEEGCISESPPLRWCDYYICTTVSLQSHVLDDLWKEEFKCLLDEAFEDTNKVHVGRFCLSRMSADHHEQLLIRFPLKVLRIYLFWPCHHFFLDAANNVWDLLPGNHFACLLHIIICQKIVTLWKDFDYVDLLRQFWHRSPVHLKQCVEGTDIFKILMEIVKHGFHQKDVPRYFFLHKQCFVDNTILCKEMTDKFTSDQ
ncbi:uncharacterized protein TNCV_5138861 [Trichonephila clavipes]|nr:uncharacterized protein TNCV_5138861 [Trichonephila clavipes]